MKHGVEKKIRTSGAQVLALFALSDLEAECRKILTEMLVRKYAGESCKLRLHGLRSPEKFNCACDLVDAGLAWMLDDDEGLCVSPRFDEDICLALTGGKCANPANALDLARAERGGAGSFTSGQKTRFTDANVTPQFLGKVAEVLMPATLAMVEGGVPHEVCRRLCAILGPVRALVFVVRAARDGVKPHEWIARLRQGGTVRG